MDYELWHDNNDQLQMAMSMGHEAISYWFNEELKGNLTLLTHVITELRSLSGSERLWNLTGHEYSLSVQGDEVTIYANSLISSQDELPENMNYCDAQSIAHCGVDDFLHLLAACAEFIRQ